MAKHKNYVIFDTSQEMLQRLAEEYIMIGREVKLDQGRLTVFALPRKRRK
jgi:hypothetical protein